MSGFWHDIKTEMVLQAAGRYQRPRISNVLNDPYHGSGDAQANVHFVQTLSRYRARTLAPIVLAVQGDTAWLRSRIAACWGWSLVCVAAALGIVLLAGMSWIAAAAAVPLASIVPLHRETARCRAELNDNETFFTHLHGWTLQFKLAEVSVRARAA